MVLQINKNNAQNAKGRAYYRMKDTAIMVVATLFVIVFIPITIMLWGMAIDDIKSRRNK